MNDNQRTQSVEILSIQMPVMGHVTYGNMMRRYFAQSKSCTLHAVWTSEGREFFPRLFIRLFCYFSLGKWVRDRNLDFRRFRGEIGIGLLGRRLVQRRIAKDTPDILHFLTQAPALISADIMRRIPSTCSIDMTSSQFMSESIYRGTRWTYLSSVALDRKAFEVAARIFPWSQWAARSLVEDFNVPESKVQVVYPGVSIDDFAIHDRSGRKGPVKLLFVGYDFERKGGNDVLDVFLNSLPQSCELHIASTAKIPADDPRVFVYNNIKAHTPEWHELYATADIFVLPTKSEAFGLVFIEASASGLPVVATNINAIPEIVVDGETGYLVPPGDRPALSKALNELFNHPEKRVAMGLAGRRRAETMFDERTNMAQMEKAFVEIARSAASRQCAPGAKR